MHNINLIAQAASDTTLHSSMGGGGTLVVILVSLAAGYITGLCIWREDQKRFTEAEKVNKGLQSQIDEARAAQS